MIHRLGSLAESEPKWSRITESDRTGFCGLTCSACLSADRDPGRFTPDGHCVYNFKTKHFEAVDSDVVCFMPRPEDLNGAHSPILTDVSQLYATYPPNTLFRLVGIKAPGERMRVHVHACVYVCMHAYRHRGGR